MRGHADLLNQVNLHGVAQAAVRRAAGQCEAFWGEYAGDDDFLRFLGSQAPSRKSLRLISCYDVSNEGFAESIKKLPLLEELELSLCLLVFEQDVFEIVGKSCPQLKHSRLSKHGFYSFEDTNYNNDREALGIATMTGLCSIQIFGNNLTNEGLMAILDNCPHLESLDIRHCFNVSMDDTVRAKCAGIKTMRLPHDSTHDYEFFVPAPVWFNDTESEDDWGPVLTTMWNQKTHNFDDHSCYVTGVPEDELDEDARMVLNSLLVSLKQIRML